MSTLANETLLENIYDEVWVEYAKANDLTFDPLAKCSSEAGPARRELSHSKGFAA